MICSLISTHKSPKWIKLFLIMCPIDLYYNFMLRSLYDMDSVKRITQLHENIILIYSSFVSFEVLFQRIKNLQNIQIYFEWFFLLVYIIYIVITVFLKLFDTYGLERLKRMRENDISVYLSLMSFVTLFQIVKSSKYTKIFWMMYSMDLYYNPWVIQPLWHEFAPKHEYKCIKNGTSLIRLFIFCIICGHILTYKITKIYNAILNHVLRYFI
jgi:hypothetical protein